MKKKVLYFITKATWGGAQRYVFDLATNIPRSKFEPIVAYGTEGKLAGDLRAAGVATKQLSSLGRDIAIISDIQSFFEILRVLREIRPDVVHLNSSKAAALGALAARIMGIPRIVSTVHGWPFKEDRNMFWRMVVYAASWLSALLSHTAIVISKADELEGKRMWLVRKKIKHVPLGIGPTDLLPQTKARDEIVPTDVSARHQHDVWVASIAELHPNKNLFTAIDAVALYNETHLPRLFYCIIGEGELRVKLDEYLTRRRIREHVLLLGFVPEAARFLKVFDILFLPSRKEGFPYVLLEAGYAGIAVVASNVGGIPDIVSEEAGITKEPDDSQGFSQALYEYTKDPDRRIRAGAALNLRTRSEFSLQKMLADTIGLYRS